jgi:hypothetical protein
MIYVSEDRVVLPGTEGMLSAKADLVRTLSLLSETIRRETRPDDGLVVFPEGEVLNYLTERRNPLRHKLYIPGYLSDENEAAVLAELQNASPAALVIANRATPEYGKRFFGDDYARRIAAWIRESYVEFPFDPGAAHVPGDSGARLFLRKPRDAGGAENRPHLHQQPGHVRPPDAEKRSGGGGTISATAS